LIECTTRSPSIRRRDGRAAPSRRVTTQPQRDGAALPRRDVMHFVTLSPFHLILIGGQSIVMDSKIVLNLVILASAVLVLSCGQTDTDAESQTRMIAILTRLPSTSVVNT